MSEARQCIDCGRGAEPQREHCPRCGGELEFVDVLEFAAKIKDSIEKKAIELLREGIEAEKIPFDVDDPLLEVMKALR